MQNRANPFLGLYVTPQHLTFQGLASQGTSQLIMERATGRCAESSHFNPLDYTTDRQMRTVECFSLIGVISIDDQFYIAVITKANTVGQINGKTIYEIKDVEFLPLQNQQQSEKVTERCQGMIKLLTEGCYFSYEYDLTNCLQRQNNQSSLHEGADEIFYWNYQLYTHLINQDINVKWFIPIIQGYIEIQRFTVQNTECQLSLISRRSWKHTGTRFSARGIDSEGNVANYVESEQILQNDQYVQSYVQIRGSVPLYWEQTGIISAISLNKSLEQSNAAFVRHIQDLIERFSHITMINLLAQNQENERLLTRSFNQLFEQNQQMVQNKVQLTHFDYHTICKGSPQNIQALFDQVQLSLNYYEYFLQQDGRNEKYQKGVIRTNCLDCLDRTNIVQGCIAWSILAKQLRNVNIEVPQNLYEMQKTELRQKFQTIWANNADKLSNQYTGTDSTSSLVTRKGKQGLKGTIAQKLVSVHRFYNANTKDQNKQEAYETFLKNQQKSAPLDKITSELNQRKSEWTQNYPISMRVACWNLAGRKPPVNVNITDWLLGGENPHIIIVCLQEIVKLNPKYVLRQAANQGAVQQWVELIQTQLDQKHPNTYKVQIYEDLVGCFIALIVQKQIMGYIGGIEKHKVKIGFKGIMGNKGSTIILFKVKDTIIVAANCHLSSGVGHLNSRLSEVRLIESKLGKLVQGMQQYHIVKIFAGDLNFRIMFSNDFARELIRDGDFENLLKHDELLLSWQHDKCILNGFKEGQITFNPTYKYDKGTDTYDTSRKRRPPAWTDRILYYGQGITLNEYYTCVSTYSDHKPIFAMFTVNICEFDQQRKDTLKQQIAQRLQNQSDQQLTYQDQSLIQVYESEGEIEEIDNNTARRGIYDVDLLELNDQSYESMGLSEDYENNLI